jgi:hypothetical protein
MLQRLLFEDSEQSWPYPQRELVSQVSFFLHIGPISESAVEGECLLVICNCSWADFIWNHQILQSCNTNLLAALANNPNLSQLVAVISAAGLNDTVTKLDNATVLAPTNSAVAALNATLAANNLTLADVTGRYVAVH